MSPTETRRGVSGARRWAALVALGCFVAFVVAIPAASSVGRPSGTKAAPYLPTTVVGATTVPLVVPPGRVVIDGKGFGHGVGLAQDGAFWMGKAGKTSTQILAHFFPGTTLAKRNGVIRVPLAAIGSMTVTMPTGGSAGGVPVPAGRSVRLVAGAGVVSASVVGASRATSVDGAGGTAPGTSASGTSAELPVPATTAGATPLSSIAGADVTKRDVVEAADRTESPSDGVGGFSAPIPEVLPTVPASVESAPSSTISVPVSSSLIPPASSDASTSIPGPADDIDPADAVQVRPGTASVNAPVIRVTAAPGGVVVVGTKRYRGTVEFASRSQGMKVVNELDVEQYLRGMAEVLDPRWPAAALQAQAVVARTYALRMMGTRGEVCPTQACQVYVGAQAEFPEMDAAVAATAGRVVLFNGELANTFYSASGGGSIAEPSEVFGPGPTIPYLRAGTYPTGDPKAWRVEMTLVELGRRVGYPGTLSDVQVSKVGPSGRAVEVAFYGSAGARSMAGPVFDRILGLRSTNFRLLVGRSSTSGTTLPWTGTVPSLDVAPSEGSSPLDFQSGLFDPASEALTNAGPSAVTSPVSSTVASPVTSAVSSPAPDEEGSSSGLPSTVVDPSGGVDGRSPSAPSDPLDPTDAINPSNPINPSKTVELAIGSDGEAPSDRTALMFKGAVGVALLASLMMALRWSARPEGQRTHTSAPKRTTNNTTKKTTRKTTNRRP